MSGRGGLGSIEIAFIIIMDNKLRQSGTRCAWAKGSKVSDWPVSAIRGGSTLVTSFSRLIEQVQQYRTDDRARPIRLFIHSTGDRLFAFIVSRIKSTPVKTFALQSPVERLHLCGALAAGRQA